jgi:hypothetical protein
VDYPYTLKKFGIGTTILFDGYDTKKYVTHNRRSRDIVGSTVHFTPSMKLKHMKSLLNKENKQRFIPLLSMKLGENRLQTLHSAGDADLLIVQTTISICITVPATAVMDEETDLLILHCQYSESNTRGLTIIEKFSF